ncbi:MAG: hypothetical protein ACFFBP_06640 [Promethearchaeota archaeon]
MSKFERHKKSTEEDIYPHRHCKGCNKMIEESIWYCPECYKKLQEKKKKKRFSRLRKRKNSKNNSEKKKES